MEKRYQGWWNVNMMGTTAGRYNMKFRKPHIGGRTTYTASLAREKDSTKPLNKILPVNMAT
jgi:hypothetical protein